MTSTLFREALTDFFVAGGIRWLNCPADGYLDEFDRKMAKRGVKVVRYVHDIVVVTRRKRATEHMLESC